MTVPYCALPIDLTEVDYAYGPDSAPRSAAGTITRFELTDSAAFPGTSRSVWVHAPHGHDAEMSAKVMFFNDGWWYLDPDGDVRAGAVLENLAAAGELPSMIGVFVDPGVLHDAAEPKNRNTEYDAFDARYADFLLDEVLPIVASQYAVSPHATDRGICGGSSGGNAAFTASWSRPDAIGRVIAFNPSFAQMPGGNPYPALLATQPPRQLRIALHAAQRDLNWDQPDMNWFAESLETAAALARAGYDFRLFAGDGGHSPNHGGVLLPDVLRWLWRS